MKMTVITYDLLGNSDEGYDVNDKAKYGDFDFDGDFTCDLDITRFLNKNYFNKHIEVSQLNFDGDDTICYVNSDSDGMPICEIFPV